MEWNKDEKKDLIQGPTRKIGFNTRDSQREILIRAGILVAIFDTKRSIILLKAYTHMTELICTRITYVVPKKKKINKI